MMTPKAIQLYEEFYKRKTAYHGQIMEHRTQFRVNPYRSYFTLNYAAPETPDPAYQCSQQYWQT